MVTCLVVEAWIENTSSLVTLHPNPSDWHQEEICSLEKFIFAVHPGVGVKVSNSYTLVSFPPLSTIKELDNFHLEVREHWH